MWARTCGQEHGASEVKGECKRLHCKHRTMSLRSVLVPASTQSAVIISRAF